MLVLQRKMNERIVIDEGRIVVTILDYHQGKVRLGIEAPKDCRVDREEIHEERRRRLAGGDPP